ncbi:ferric iron reductase [Glutamicibacter halophytocola]|uniref:ferric iron reductase n=1 Tax=Glutamicibacter halophytocola TaxID=1933880 RepID=UPI00321BE7AF
MAAYDLVFMPHGENVIMILENGAVKKVLLKDLGEEIAVLSDRVQLPEEIRRVRTGGDPVLSVFTDVFDSFFRFLAPLLDVEGILPEEDFWKIVVERLLDYRAEHPEFARRFDELGLFEKSFPLSCLNRLQLRNNQQMLDLTDQSGGLLYAGDLENPLAFAVLAAN